MSLRRRKLKRQRHRLRQMLTPGPDGYRPLTKMVPWNLIHHARCPLCRKPMEDKTHVIFNKVLGEVHLACTLIKMFEEGKS